MDDLYSSPKKFQDVNHHLATSKNSSLFKIMNASYYGQISKDGLDSMRERLEYLIFRITVVAGALCNRSARSRISGADIRLATTIVLQQEADKRPKKRF